MRGIALALIGTLLVAVPAAAQQAVPIHNNFASADAGTGAVEIIPARVRSLLGLQNDHASVVVYCTVDGTTAAANTGIRLLAAGANHVLFDTKVPTGALRCAASGGPARILIQEGQ